MASAVDVVVKKATLRIASLDFSNTSSEGCGQTYPVGGEISR